MSGVVVERLHFNDGIAAEHVRDNTYHWVDPITGQHKGYIVAEPVEYAPTIDEQYLRSRRR